MTRGRTWIRKMLLLGGGVICTGLAALPAGPATAATVPPLNQPLNATFKPVTASTQLAQVQPRYAATYLELLPCWRTAGWRCISILHATLAQPYPPASTQFSLR